MALDLYAAYPSVQAGDDVVLHVSTTARRFYIDLYRQGEQLDRVQSYGPFAGDHVLAGTADADWGWPPYRIETLRNMRSGVYVIVGREEGVPSVPLNGADARTGRALVVVRAASPAAGGILYKVPICTYHAYNYSGGGSLYWDHAWTSDGCKVTLRRPGGGTGGAITELEDVYDPATPRQTFAHWDAPFIAWLESLGHTPDYCADIDVGLAGLVDGYSLLLSAGHDEYWTPEVRAATERFIDAGGNLAVFGADTCWWRVRLVDEGTAIVCGKSKEQSSSGPDQWWRFDPENSFLGVSYRNAGGWWDGAREPVGYTVQNERHWVFEGTDLQQGDVLAAKERLVGYECDGARYKRDGAGIAVPTGEDGTPLDFTILGVGTLSPRWQFVEREGDDGVRAATLGLRESRGTVFTAATTDWARLVPLDPRVERITRNVIDRLAG